MIGRKENARKQVVVSSFRMRLLPSLAAICLLLLLPPAGSTTEPGVTLGILPTLNGGGDAFGDTFDQHLSLKLFELFHGSKVRPVLLNPGRMYDPSEDDWLKEYGGSSGCDVLLITTLLKTDSPEKGDWTINVQSELLDLKSGKRSGAWKTQVSLDRKDAHLDYLHWQTGLWSNSVGPSRVFEKQPLGKAMKVAAEQIYEQSLRKLESVPAESGVSPGQRTGPPCDVHLKILYVSKHAASKSYRIFVDGKDESQSVKDGELVLHGKSGTLLL